MAETQRWYVTVSDRLSGSLQYCTYSTVIEEHPVVWALREGKDLVFAMAVSTDKDRSETKAGP